MMETVDSHNTLFALRQTSKGRLNYQKEWGCTKDIQCMLEDCTSPPKVSIGVSEHGDYLTKKVLNQWLESNNNAKNYDIAEEVEPNVITSCESDNSSSSKSAKLASPSICKSKRPSPRKRQMHPTSPEPNITQYNYLQSSYCNSQVVSPQACKVEMNIKHIEEEMRTEAENNLLLRRERMEENSRRLHSRSIDQVIAFERKQQLEARVAEEMLEASHQNMAEQIEKNRDKLKESHKRHAQILNEKILKVEAQKKRLEEQERKQREEAEKIRVNVSGMVDAMRALKKNLDDKIAKCKCKQHLAPNFTKFYENVVACVTKAESLVLQMNEDKKVASVLKMIQELSLKQQNIADVINQDLDRADKKAAEEVKQKQATEQKRAAEEAARKAAAEAAKAKDGATGLPLSLLQGGDGEILCVLPDSLKQYEDLLKKQKEVETSIVQLTTTPQLKKLKMDLQKAVNTPVNALTNTSGAHLRDKLDKLLALLSGQPVEVSGKRVLATEHPSGLPFCFDLLAKKLVKQGEEQISSNHEYAFVYAAIAVAIWCKFPVFGELLRAHFYLRCPYLVPYYKPKTEGQSSEDYYKSLGYQYKDGEVEQQDKFLKRMSGITRLYAAIMISVPPPGSPGKHPFDLDHGWTWLATVLNIDPRPDITASEMFDFLEITGNQMWRAYKKQFQKILHIICTEYLPKIWKVTPKGSGGPVKRLELFLTKCLQTGTIASAKGTLAANFWLT